MNDRHFLKVVFDEYKPLREIVFDTIREAIIRQILKPGERLMEVQLAEEMGVSRTPVREALRKLELEGFVTITPRKGAYVTSISISDIQEIYEIRAALESLACGLAAERATEEEIAEMKRFLVKEAALVDSNKILDTVDADIGLHDLICMASRNERLLNTLDKLRKKVYQTRVAVTSLPGRKRRSHEGHRQLVEAIASRETELARNLMLAHVERAQEAIISYLKGSEVKNNIL